MHPSLGPRKSHLVLLSISSQMILAFANRVQAQPLQSRIYEATSRFTFVTVCLFVSPTYSGICQVAPMLQITPHHCTSDYIADRLLRWVTPFSQLEFKELNLASTTFRYDRGSEQPNPNLGSFQSGFWIDYNRIASLTSDHLRSKLSFC